MDHIYKITPILRPFEVKLQAANPLKLLDENGKSVANASYTSATLQNAVDGTAIRFTSDSDNTIQVTANNKGMVKFVGLDIVKEGVSHRIVTVPSGATTATFKLTNEFIKNNLYYIDFPVIRSFLLWIIYN